MQALLESVERQSALHQQLRGLKHTIVSTANRLHVATRISEEDGASMAQLRQEALHAEKHSMEAEKKASSAADIVQNLTNEIINLKKALKDANILPKNDRSNISFSGASKEMTNFMLEEEVDELMDRYSPFGDDLGQLQPGKAPQHDFTSLPLALPGGEEYSPATSPKSKNKRHSSSLNDDGVFPGEIEGIAYNRTRTEPTVISRPFTSHSTNGNDFGAIFSSTG